MITEKSAKLFEEAKKYIPGELILLSELFRQSVEILSLSQKGTEPE